MIAIFGFQLPVKKFTTETTQDPMPNIRSAAKRMRQNVGRRAANRANIAALRTSIKKLDAAIETDAKAATSQLKETSSVIAKAARKGLIHKKNAARHTSRLAKRLNKAAAQAKG